MNVKYFNTLDK